MERTHSPVIARSPQGEACYCRCADRVTMEFKNQRFVFESGGLARFRRAFGRLLGSADVLPSLLVEAKRKAERDGRPAERLPSIEDLHEMLGLVDTSLLVLEALAIVRRAG
jgi:hypothetical protein